MMERVSGIIFLKKILRCVEYCHDSSGRNQYAICVSENMCERGKFTRKEKIWINLYRLWATEAWK